MEIVVKDQETGASYRSNPARDIAFFYPQLVLDVANRLERQCREARVAGAGDPSAELRESWLEDVLFLKPEEKARLAASRLPGDLLKTFARFCQVLVLAIDPDLKTPQAAIDASGFLESPPELQALVLEKFSKSCFGAFWAGIRSSVFELECPPVLTTLKRRGAEMMDACDPGRRPPA